MSSQLNNAMQMKKVLETNLKNDFEFANKQLKLNNKFFNGYKVIEFRENSILVDPIGVKKYTDLTVEELQELENTISLDIIQDEAVKKELSSNISKIKTKLLETIKEFVNIKELYFPFSKCFNLEQKTRAFVLSNQIIGIFESHIQIINPKNSFEIKYYEELDLLTLSAIYDIIHNFFNNYKKSVK